jgi:hypothetical protein
MGERKPDGTRGVMSFALIIIIALVIGIFLKNVKLGLIIGLALGLLGSSFLRR